MLKFSGAVAVVVPSVSCSVVCGLSLPQAFVGMMVTVHVLPFVSSPVQVLASMRKHASSPDCVRERLAVSMVPIFSNVTTIGSPSVASRGSSGMVGTSFAARSGAKPHLTFSAFVSVGSVQSSCATSNWIGAFATVTSSLSVNVVLGVRTSPAFFGRTSTSQVASTARGAVHRLSTSVK